MNPYDPPRTETSRRVSHPAIVGPMLSVGVIAFLLLVATRAMRIPNLDNGGTLLGILFIGVGCIFGSFLISRASSA